MTTEMILLGLLFDKPLSGYDIRKICQKQFTHYADINPSSIYFSLKKLEKLKLINGKTMQGERLEKIQYQITDEGKKKFKELLLKNLSEENFPRDDFNAALSFVNYADSKIVKEILLKRKEVFTVFLKKIEEFKKESDDKKKYGNKILLERGIIHIKAELNWIKQALEDLQVSK